MAEYIKREEALKAIESASAWGSNTAYEAVQEVPAADVAPVVRCKDCKHGVYNEDDKDPYVFCQVRGCDICPMDGYCYRGSTKEG